MNRLFFVVAFLLGAAAVIWMASTFVGSNTLALTVTLVIACVYAIGFMELLQFRRATSSLTDALAAIPETMEEGAAQLDQWVASLHGSLQNAVRLRIEGDRVGLPAPIITPYLVGLLVMLGLLGTFLGMVETLSGAVIALEGTTELQAIREGLAAPIKGLSVAFGTSVAGVAASAMLGLISTLSRRDRMLATRVLDGKIAGVFRCFSLAYNRQQTYKALQVQAQALPQVAEQLNAMATQLSLAGEQLSDKLIASQAQFHESAQAVYQELATSVGASLKSALAESGRLAGESIKPVVAQAMADISNESQAAHQGMAQAAQQQSMALAASFNSTSEAVSAAWQSGLIAHQASSEKLINSIGGSLAGVGERFEATAETLLASATQSFESMSGTVTSQWMQAGEQIAQLSNTVKVELASLRDEEEKRGEAALERLGSLEATAATHLATLGKELEEPMRRLIETASETPRAAAEVIGKLRDEVSNNIERDNQLLEERQRIMAQLDALSSSLEQTSAGQREALENLVSSSATLLEKVGERFDERVGTQVTEMSGIAENFSGSAIEMASLGEAFTVAVGLFNESNGKLMDSLARIEQSMDNTSARSDEQMNYYVSQARQIIDQSMQSQREIFEGLRQHGAATLTEAS